MTSSLTRLLSGDIRGGLGEAGYITAGQLPTTRSIRDLILQGQDTRPRYASGDVIERADERPEGIYQQLWKASRFPAPQDQTRLREVAEDKDREKAREYRRSQRS